MEGSGDGGYIDEFVSVDLELSTLLSSVLGRSTAVSTLLEDEDEPEGGWDVWCSKISRKGKIARIIRTIAKNVMSFEWTGGEEDTRKAMRSLSRKIQLRTKLMQLYRDWLVYGRFFAEVVSEKTPDKKFIVHELRVIPPPSIKVYRDTHDDIDRLKIDLADKAGYKRYLQSLRPGAGDKIIGYIQKVSNSKGTSTNASDLSRKNNDRGQGEEITFFKPNELVFLPRYPDHDMPNGVSLLRENYDTIMDKLGYARSQSIMVKRHIDPKLIFTIPREQWGDRKRIQQEIKFGIKAGMDIFIPEGMTINVLQSSGMGGGVSEAIKYTENEFNAAMGFADSFTSSDSSNRSVGEIQLQFFEKDVNAEREIFTEVLDKQLINPYVYWNFNTRDYPDLKWSDIQPKDRKVCVQLATPFINMMTINQLIVLMEDIGYPVSLKDLKEFKQNVETARGGMMGMGGDTGGGIPGYGTPMGGSDNTEQPDGVSGTNQWGVPDAGSVPDASLPSISGSFSDATKETVDLNAVTQTVLNTLVEKMYAMEEMISKLQRELNDRSTEQQSNPVIST